MKIAFSGKGGVGKTTLAGLTILALVEKGYKVLAVDADPDANLAAALKFPKIDTVPSIANMKDLINERMGVTEKDRTIYKLNPRISDIPEQFLRVHNNISLLVMGGVEKGGSGCVCPESVFLRELLKELILRRDEHIVVDMEAGIEHLGRRTAQSMDILLIVVEPTKNSVNTASRIIELSKQVGIKKTAIIANKIRNQEDVKFIRNNLKDCDILSEIKYSDVFLNIDKVDNFDVLSKDEVFDVVRRLITKLL